MKLHKKIFLGLIVGTSLGLFCNLIFPENKNIVWIASNIANPLGQIFLRIVFMAVIPLVISALVIGVAEIGDVKKIGKIGVKTLLFTLLFSSIAVFIGVGRCLCRADSLSLLTLRARALNF